MKYKRFGKTDKMVSELGLGTAQIGGPSIIKGKPFGAKPITDEEAFKILAKAYDRGINFYDSADLYGDGLAETRLGKFFGDRPEILIATKCGLNKDGNREFNRNYVLKCLEGSLKRLKRERIDIFQLTKPTAEDWKRDTIYETFEYLKTSGKIRYAGISVGTVEEGIFLAQQPIDSLQIIYNLLTVEFSENLIPAASRLGIGVIIRSPLSGGMLAGCINENTKFPDYDDRKVFLHGDLLRKRSWMVAQIREKFNLKSNGELVTFSLNYILSNPDVTLAIPGSTSVVQLEQNLLVLEKPRFTPDEWKEIHNFARTLSPSTVD